MAETSTITGLKEVFEGLTVFEQQQLLSTFEEQQRELNARRAEIQRQLDGVQSELNAVNSIIGFHVNELKLFDDEARESFPPETLDQLLEHPSYAQDFDFEPSEDDKALLEEMTDREAARSNAESNLRTTQASLDAATSARGRVGTMTAALQREIDAIESNWISSILNRWTKRTQKARDEIAQLESGIDADEQRIPELRRKKNAAVEAVARTQQDKTYDESVLHAPALQAETLSARTRQSVPITISQSQNMYTIQLHLPRTTDDRRFARTITLEMDQSDAAEFLRLAGETIPVDTQYYSQETLDSVISDSYDITDPQLVPFPLEIVRVGDQLHFRIPQVVWDRFSSFRQ